MSTLGIVDVSLKLLSKQKDDRIEMNYRKINSIINKIIKTIFALIFVFKLTFLLSIMAISCLSMY